MAQQDSERRLAAVWFADIVGYTELSSKDEDGALQVVRAFQSLSDSVVPLHGGRVVKFIGDAVLTEFPSTDAALRAALAFLADFTDHPDVRPFGGQLRIGVHVGEVIGAADGDIYGDGVNLASRLQGQAAPGRIFVSEAVYQQIKQRPVMDTRSVGTRIMKGLADPIGVYEVAYAGALPAPLPNVEAMDGAPGRRQWPRSRAMAAGVTLGLVTFVALISFNAFEPRGTVDSIERLVFTSSQLTFTGSSANPRFSPDGTRIAIVRDAGPYGGELAILPLDGSDAAGDLVAADVASFSWAGGDRLVWSDGSRGGTYSSAGGAAAARLSQEAWNDFTVDAGQESVTRLLQTREGTLVLRQALVGAAVAGATVTEATVDTVFATAEGVHIREGAWSPDGRWLAASVIDAEGRSTLQLFAGADGSMQTVLPQRAGAPVWSARGDAIYFVGEVDRVDGLHVVGVDPDTGARVGAPYTLISGRTVEAFDVAPDGTIAFTSVQRRANVVAMDVNDPAATARPVTRGTAPISSPSLDRTGARLAFVRNGDVYVSDADGDDERQVTRLGGNASGLRWSPDGAFLAYISETPTQRRLEIVTAEGDQPRTIPLRNPLPQDLEPVLTWAPDGLSVVYVGADEFGWPNVLSRVDLRSEVDRDLLRGDPTHVSAAFIGLVASPDGREVAALDATGALLFVALEDGSAREVYPDVPGTPVAWTEDGRVVLRSLLDPADLVLVRPDGSSAGALFRSPVECDAVTLSGDVLKAACTVLEQFERDVWIARPQRVSGG